jgi:hypothetical protein
MNFLLTKSKKKFIKAELEIPANLPNKQKKPSVIYVTAEPV